MFYSVGHDFLHVRNGSTLVELLVVVALVGLLCGIGVGTFSFLHRGIVKAAVDELHTTCTYLQQRSFITNSETELVFDCAHNQYSWDVGQVQLPHVVRFGAVVGAQGPPATPHAPITQPITFQQARIKFAPSGIVQAGSVYLVDSSGQYGYALTSAVGTYSYLRRYRYAKGWQSSV